MIRIEVEIYNTLFLPFEASIGTDREAMRVERYLADFRRALPLVNYLRHSVLVTHKQHAEDGLNLSIRLQDLGVRSLLESSMGHTGQDLNGFESEVAAVRAEIERLPATIARALNPSITPSRLQDRSKEMEQIRALRELLMKRRGLHVLSAFRLPGMAASGKVFAQGTVAAIRADIDSIHDKDIRLKNVTFSDSDSDASAGIQFIKRMSLSRHGIEGTTDMAIQFLSLLNAKQSTWMEVLVTWEIAGGRPDHLEFLRFLQ